MKKTKTKCYLYTRVSTSMQVDGYSLDAQRDKLRKYAEYEDMVVAGEYSDEGFSGKNIQGRHEFQRMLQDIQDCKDGVEYVLVFKLSRFGRNAADVLNSLQLMQDFGVNLICVEDGIDSSKDSGKLMISVLSAVAEIERENIRTQTMAGREQKAREGKWNGGFAPYGYRLEKGELLIAEDEVDVIRTIFDRYIHTNDGVSGVAKYLNRQGFVKKLRQNGTIPGFSASFVKSIIDNPVYMGKIAYGRRRTEKKIGTRNEMHVVEQSEFPVYEGKHEAIISEEDWNLAQEKRKINAYRREKVNDPTHAHILSGILKCPCCGKSLYGNIAKAHSKDKKTRYYYYCKNTVTPTGHECTFRLNIEQMEMNRMVASIISAMVSDPRFADAIKAKIGSAVDTNDLEKQLEALQAQLRQTLGTKARLERQMDGLDVNDPYYDRKISDLQRRYDEQYGAIDEIEVQIDDVQSQIRSIRQEKISGDNIYRLLLAFDQVYEAASEVERKEFMRAFIERIELFPEKQPDGNWIRKIIFNFPVPVNGTEVKELPLENETIVETFLAPSNLIAEPGVTTQDLEAARQKAGEDFVPFESWNTPDNLFWLSIPFYLSKYDDRETGTCSFETQEFYDFLLWCKTWGGDGSPRNTDEKAILHYQQLSYVDQVCGMSLMAKEYLDYPDSYTYAGIPNEDTCGTMMSVTLSLGVSGSCRNETGAAEFLTFCRGYELRGLPADMVRLQAEIDAQRATGQEDEMDVRNVISPEDAEKFYALLEEKPTLRNQDDALVDILCEEAAPYFAGDVDEKTAAKTMQARTKLLLLEQAG